MALTPLPGIEPAPQPTRTGSSLRSLLGVGAVAIVLVVVPFASFELDSFSVPKELVLHLVAALAGLLLLVGPGRFRLTRFDGLLLAVLGLSLVSALFAQNGWNAGRSLAMTGSGVLVFWAARRVKTEGEGYLLARAGATMTVLAALMALVQAYGLDLILFAEDRAPGGTLGNRNSVGHLAAMGLPLLVLVGWTARRWLGVLLASGGLFLVLAALVLTRSRAAWLGTGAILGLLALGIVIILVQHRAWRLLGRTGLLLAVGALGVFAAMSVPNALRWSSVDPYTETAQNVLNYREGSGQGRLSQYQTSLRLLASDPVLGVGPGNWPVEYPRVARRGDPSMSGREAGRTTNPWPSSDLLALLVERGPLTFLLWILVLLGLARSGLRQIRTATSPDGTIRGLTLLAVLAGTVVVGAFDAVLLLSWPTFLFWLTMGALWSADGVRELSLGTTIRTVAVLVLVAGSSLAALRSAGQLAAMAIYDSGPSRERLETAATFDPGNYRLRLRLGQNGNRDARCPHALAAADLFPHSGPAQQTARRCR